MEETGRVIKNDEKCAVVRVDRKSECDKCGMCVFPNNAGYIDFNADNSIGAKVGDDVTIRTSDNGKLLGALLVFLVPLILIGIAALITFTLIKREIFVLVLSAAFIAVWFIVLSVLDERLKTLKSFSTEIIHIAGENGEKEKENGDKERNE